MTNTNKDQIKKIEVDIWINKAQVGKFMTEFSHLNDVKFDGEDLVSKQILYDGQIHYRIALFYRVFGDKKIEYPEQTYYQLNNVFEGE